MANRWFRRYLHALLTGGAKLPNWTTADLRVVLIDIADDDPDTTITGDEYLSNIAAAAREAVTLALTNVTVVDGVIDADDVALPDDGGDPSEELVLYAHTGVEATSRLLVCIDTATGLPITPDSVADMIRWHASGIAAL